MNLWRGLCPLAGVLNMLRTYFVLKRCFSGLGYYLINEHDIYFPVTLLAMTASIAQLYTM